MVCKCPRNGLLRSAELAKSGGKRNSSVDDFVAVKASKNTRVQEVSTNRHLQAGRSKVEPPRSTKESAGHLAHLA